MRLPIYKPVKNLYFGLLALLLAGCTLEKESRFNRAMQNLTAHYNILFNANEILAQKQAAYAVSYVDAYDRFLSVYPDTTAKSATADKMLEQAITKANTIIANKEQSHYIADAYMVLGKANYMEANFFNSIEFLNYVIQTYPRQKSMVQDARVWKARALMRINQLSLADTTLDTALVNIFPKQQNIADVYATKLQYDLYTEHYKDAELMAKQAIRYSHDITHKLRWTFILAQLQEHNHKPDDAVLNYTRIANSNAPFEMAFNASLNRIRIQEKQNGQKINRLDALRRLLKDDKNVDFIDQIYYQIGELYLAQGNIKEAIKNFKLSIRKSTKNLNQKGLSYLRIADIDFNNLADYQGSKKYYDSTLVSLSPNYPGYQAIYKKAANLQLLTDRLQIIAREDTLQMLAKMDEAARGAKITAMVNALILQQQTISNNTNNALSNSGAYTNPNQLNEPGGSKGGGPGGLPSSSTGGGGAGGGTVSGNFYFYNTSAVSQGFTDFKRVWGNRQLADNWRRSVKSGSETNNVQLAATLQDLNSMAYSNQSQKTNDNVLSTRLQQDILQSVPLTPALMQQSNTRILNAYTDIANFYRDILDDKKEAIVTYEKILARFPDNINIASVYYNLYRLYSDIDAAKSDYYKNLILTKYPESNFAKVILDPDFNQKLNDKNAEYTAFYNQLFDQVYNRKYTEAAARADELLQQYPGNSLSPQVYYLRMVALGHSQTIEPFRKELQEIADKFPDDRLITPLVKLHLLFIDANQADMQQRNPVLTDSDPNEIAFLLRPIHVDNTYIPRQQPIAKTQPAVAKPVTPIVKKPVTPIAVKPVAPTVATVVTPPVVNAAKPAEVVKEAPSIFNMKDSTEYFFVINVNTATTSMASSRFGIGQFNRANLPPNTTIKHQLKPVADHQLIYVGRFGSLATAKDYARAIAPLLPDIMKVTADKYNFFIITQENLDKLADKKTLDSYFDFYQKHY
ncbi:tetratricopeptide repeat protein [Mucilaginibacter gracilis]|uniref:Tetratricopeptide repeat protein n=1 Tax=Mucilaginibacter gracilis TaxID=423350 RepID=A0A495IYA8_9SPHI|nr:tetratricopeptide repeat protein [Mucilaginibacter gracilis]RKR81667.1 tetratricopeptide repeat protein [Mucilaginibacter gracilis]